MWIPCRPFPLHRFARRRMEAKLRTMEQRLALDGSAAAVGAADMVSAAAGVARQAPGQPPRGS